MAEAGVQARPPAPAGPCAYGHIGCWSLIGRSLVGWWWMCRSQREGLPLGAVCADVRGPLDDAGTLVEPERRQGKGRPPRRPAPLGGGV